MVRGGFGEAVKCGLRLECRAGGGGVTFALVLFDNLAATIMTKLTLLCGAKL